MRRDSRAKLDNTNAATLTRWHANVPRPDCVCRMVNYAHGSRSTRTCPLSGSEACRARAAHRAHRPRILLLETAGPLLRSTTRRTSCWASTCAPPTCAFKSFLDAYLYEVCPGGAPRLPANTFILDRPGLARLMSLPPGEDTFTSPYLSSYRIPPRGAAQSRQRPPHHPGSLPYRRRRLAGFPPTSRPCPMQTFAALLAAALAASPGCADAALHRRPSGAGPLFVSLLLRPLVCPATGTDPEKTMEIRFFAPGSLVSNLDFVESIFGNAAIRIFPRTTPRSMLRTGPAIPAA